MSKTKIVTRTAVILALAIIFQNLRPFLAGLGPNSQIIIGSLVNLCIIIATGAVGFIPGLVICVVTPIIALFQGHIPHYLLAIVTLLGNAALATVFYVFSKSKFAEPINAFLGVVVGAVVKWAVMYFFGIKFILSLIVAEIKPPQVAAISLAFNFPQIITALIGGIFGIIIIKFLKNAKLVD